MRPTRLGKELAGPIRQALQLLNESLSREREYVPATSDRTFHLNLNDYTQTILLPRLMAQLKTAAPNVRLVTTSYPVDEMESALKHGALDLAVDCHDVNSAGLYQQKLFDDEFVCLVRKGHPEVRGAMTRDQFVNLPHAVIKHGLVPGLIEQLLTKSGVRREAVVSLPHCLLAPFIASRTDLIVVVPKREKRSTSSRSCRSTYSRPSAHEPVPGQSYLVRRRPPRPSQSLVACDNQGNLFERMSRGGISSDAACVPVRGMTS